MTLQIASHRPKRLPQYIEDRPEILDMLIRCNDLSVLTDEQRALHYRGLCESLGLNPLSQPFAYLWLNRRLTLYCLKDGAYQLGRIFRVSMSEPRIEYINGTLSFIGTVSTPDGRVMPNIGTTPIEGLAGVELANAIMTAMTKWHRRGILAITGLGMLDETEVETINGAEKVDVNLETGAIISTRRIDEHMAASLRGRIRYYRWSKAQVRELLQSYGFVDIIDITRDKYDEIRERIRQGPPRSEGDMMIAIV